MDDLIALLPLLTVFLLFYIILYIPQRRRQKKHKSYIEALKIGEDRKSTRLNSSHSQQSRMPSSA